MKPRCLASGIKGGAVPAKLLREVKATQEFLVEPLDFSLLRKYEEFNLFIYLLVGVLVHPVSYFNLPHIFVSKLFLVPIRYVMHNNFSYILFSV